MYMYYTQEQTEFDSLTTIMYPVREVKAVCVIEIRICKGKKDLFNKLGIVNQKIKPLFLKSNKNGNKYPM